MKRTTRGGRAAGGMASLGLLVALAVAAQGCQRLHGGPPVVGRRGGDELLTKAVRAKRPPNELIAEDLSVCWVTPDVYAGIRQGQLWRCARGPGPEEG